MEWKLKRRTAFLVSSAAPSATAQWIASVVIEWTDATRRRSQHQWETEKKRWAVGGSGPLLGCQIRKAHPAGM